MLKLSSSSLFVVGILGLVVCGCSAKQSEVHQEKVSLNRDSLSVTTESKESLKDTVQNEFIISVEGYKATPLGKAVFDGDTTMIKDLMAKGASFEKCLTDDTYVFNILYAALVSEKPEVIRYVLKNKMYTSVNDAFTEDAETPLTLGCNLADSTQALEISQALVGLGAEVNGAGASGGEQTKYPLLIAISKNNFGLTKFLLDHGANKEVKNSSGESAFTYAQKLGFSNIGNLLSGK